MMRRFLNSLLVFSLRYQKFVDPHLYPEGSNIVTICLLLWNFQIANRLDSFVASAGRNPLKVFIQVNTSGEESKSGVEPSSCVELAKHVSQNCSNLEFCGLMTIGNLDYTSTPENFKTLASCRSEVCKALGIPEEKCELSMGMSGDFEQAIEMGSTNVRIGSIIFGSREYPKKSSD
ncbi:hypothetical protein ACJRO7_021981 [Eucalyptus globulus]|uniref:Alanine racemase N-terminal domain-containing protein n=1 Tax=Eucalyptus globulus TaxID=34317 RepID=A0ABD3KN76_EUCGL